MKERRIWRLAVSGVLLLVCWWFAAGAARAEGAETIKKGIFAEEIELSGKTAEEAEVLIGGYIEQLKAISVTLYAADNQPVETSAGELGLYWSNPELVEEALELGTKGNVIERYTAMKDLEHENKVFPIEYDFDVAQINDVLLLRCAPYDRDAVNGALKRVNGAFQMVAGETGYHLDVESSIDVVYAYLTEQWDKTAGSVALDIRAEEPRGTAEELAQVKDVLGTFTTSYSSSGSSRSANVANGCQLINGTTLYPGEEFSTYEAVAPFTEKNGYYMAGSYLNGQVVDSLGGGICQVSTTLYNAVLKAELEVTERHNHSMIVTYVDPSADAAIAESSGKDFKFVNNTDSPIYIEGYTENKRITFTIYGKETRSPGRKVSYVSEVLEIIPPEEQINQDAGEPIGYIADGSAAHTGYKARLWKVVTVDGTEVSREQVNSSSYRMTPRIITVGTATGDANAYNELMAAIGTGSIDHVREVVALLAPPAPEE